MLPGVTKASKFDEEKKLVKKLRTKKKLVPYQDDSLTLDQLEDASKSQLGNNDAKY